MERDGERRGSKTRKGDRESLDGDMRDQVTQAEEAEARCFSFYSSAQDS